jgi:hypothetical protein
MLTCSGSARDPAAGISLNRMLRMSPGRVRLTTTALIPRPHHDPRDDRGDRGRSFEPGSRVPGPIPVRQRQFLVDVGAGVGVDFQADGDLDDDRGLPLHGGFLGLIFTVAR